jgi:hypothetical protein
VDMTSSAERLGVCSIGLPFGGLFNREEAGFSGPNT